MAGKGVPDDWKWDIHASVVRKLGLELVSDDVQALSELIKNAYDADADWAEVTIDTTATGAQVGSHYPDAVGYVQVTDNGEGMDPDRIKQGWLLISTTYKRKMKARGQLTGRGRTPLGDKGLGRLSTQRLGDCVDIFTRTSKHKEALHVAFSWADFDQYPTVQEVPIHHRWIKPETEKGTRLVVAGLRDLEQWQNRSTRDRLQRALSAMISPYKEIRDFTVLVTVDGKKLDLTDISGDLLDTSQVKYDITFDGAELVVTGTAKLNFIRPGRKNKKQREERKLFRRLVELDDGDEFFAFLQEQAWPSTSTLERTGDGSWFVTYTDRRVFNDLDDLTLVNGQPPNPGMFSGKVHGFTLEDNDVEETFEQALRGKGIFDSAASYKHAIETHAGIRVFRDGFRIPVDEDWLGLRRFSTSASSYYALKPQNTLGYIALTARHNASLQETTDRKDFVQSPYSINFFRLTREFLKISNYFQAKLRRGWNEFSRKYQRDTAGVDDRTTPEDLAQRLKDQAAAAGPLRSQARSTRSKVKKAMDSAEQEIALSQSADTWDRDTAARVRKALATLAKALKEARAMDEQLEQYLARTENAAQEQQVLLDQFNQLQERLILTHETVSLGITAESLVHEIRNVADNLEQKAVALRRHLRTVQPANRRMLTFVNNVVSSMNAMRKQLSHLDPSLRYVREKKEPFEVPDLVRETLTYYHSRFDRKGIMAELKSPRCPRFAVRMGRGKLTQVLDNLLQNAEYWLTEDMRRGFISKGTITVELLRPFLRVSDNGRGVDPAYENTLFDPFVSAKDSGRGLGLFIAQQLLDADSCSIDLLPFRNTHNRRYIFEIDLSGGIHDNT